MLCAETSHSLSKKFLINVDLCYLLPCVRVQRFPLDNQRVNFMQVLLASHSSSRFYNEFHWPSAVELHSRMVGLLSPCSSGMYLYCCKGTTLVGQNKHCAMCCCSGVPCYKERSIHGSKRPSQRKPVSVRLNNNKLSQTAFILSQTTLGSTLYQQEAAHRRLLRLFLRMKCRLQKKKKKKCSRAERTEWSKNLHFSSRRRTFKCRVKLICLLHLLLKPKTAGFWRYSLSLTLPLKMRSQHTHVANILSSMWPLISFSGSESTKTGSGFRVLH